MRTCLIIHMGVGDHIALHGLVRYYASITPDTLVLMEQGNCTDLVHSMYLDVSNLEICMDINLHPKYLYNDMYILSKSDCSSLIRVGFDEIDWSKYPNSNINQSFYLSVDLSPSLMFSNFIIPEEIVNESIIIYNDYINKYGNDYILIHEDTGDKIIGSLNYGDIRGNFFPFHTNYYTPNLPILNLNKISNKMINYYTMILNAKEIHIMESSWAILIYILCMKEESMQNKPIFLHSYARTTKNTNMFTLPKLDNWTILL